MVPSARSLSVAVVGPAPRLDARVSGMPACLDRFRRRGAAGDQPAIDHDGSRSSLRSSAQHRTSCSTHIGASCCRIVELGLGNAVHVQTYRIAGLIPGSLGFVLADHMAWNWVFRIVALFMLVGIGLTLVYPPRRLRGPATPQTLASGDRRTVPRVHRASRGQIRASFARVHVLLQARRQHGDRAVDAVLYRSRLQSHGNRIDREERGVVAVDHRRIARRRVDAPPRHQSRVVALRRRAAGADPRLRACSRRSVPIHGRSRSSSRSNTSASDSVPRRSSRSSRARRHRRSRRHSSRSLPRSPQCRARSRMR